MICSNCGQSISDECSFCPHCGNQISIRSNVSRSDFISPYDYEECVAEHLRKTGYKNVYTTKKSGDFGADVVGTSPDGQKVCVQCKRYSNPVGVKAIQEIYSAKAYYHCELAYVFTTSSFTPQAQELADRTGVKLFVFIPDASSVPKQQYFAPRSISNHKKRGRRRIGCLIPVLIVFGLIALLTHSVEKEETKKRDEKKEIVVSAVNRDEDPSASIAVSSESDASDQPASIIVDGVCYLFVVDHMEVVSLYDFERASVRIQESIDGIPVTVIRAEAFKDEAITSVALPNSIREIQNSAFSSCRKLTKINLPDGITEIAQNTFILCESLSSVSLPTSVTKIHSGAFSSTALSSINLENVTFIDDNAFSGCRLTSVKLSPELTEIGDRAFSYTPLKSIDIPEGVTSIGVECFTGCKSLRSITLPESLVKIGKRCFQNCESLTELRIPSGVTDLKDSQMFYGDSALKVVYIPSECKIPGGSDPYMFCSARIVFY